jgi:hypothetical protein
MRLTDWLAVWADYLATVPEAERERIAALLAEAEGARDVYWNALACAEDALGEVLKGLPVHWPTGREGQVVGLDTIDKVWHYRAECSFEENITQLEQTCLQMHFDEMERPDLEVGLSATLHNVDSSFLRKLRIKS